MGSGHAAGGGVGAGPKKNRRIVTGHNDRTESIDYGIVLEGWSRMVFGMVDAAPATRP